MANGGTNDKFLRVKEIAGLLRCTRQSLYARVKRGMWPPIAKAQGVSGMLASEFDRMQALLIGNASKEQVHALVELIKRERGQRAKVVLDDMDAKAQKEDGDI